MTQQAPDTATPIDRSFLQAYLRHQLWHLTAHKLRVVTTTEPDTFNEAYLKWTGMGYAQAPFTPEHNRETLSNRNFIGLTLVSGAEVIATLAGRVTQVAQSNIKLSDALRKGLLFSASYGLVESDWIPEAGPEVGNQTLGYFGGGWVHPSWRGAAFGGLLLRVALIQTITRFPAITNMFGMVTEPVMKSGMVMNPAGWGCTDAELVCKGFLSLTGKFEYLYGVWSSVEDLLKMYKEEHALYEAGGRPDWLPGDTPTLPAEWGGAAANAPAQVTERPAR